MSISIVEGDLNNRVHQDAILLLLNTYAADPMGRGKPLTDDVQRDLIDRLKAHPTTLVLLAFEGQRAIGVAVCFRGFSTFAARPLLNVHDLAVLPESRGQGIGRLLLERTHHRATELGCCKVTLEVREDNLRAQGLYRSLGYGEGNGDGESVGMLFWTKDL